MPELLNFETKSKKTKNGNTLAERCKNFNFKSLIKFWNNELPIKSLVGISDQRIDRLIFRIFFIQSYKNNYHL